MQSLVTIAALAATVLPTVSAAVAAISNHCDVPYFVWSVSEVQSDMITIPDHTVVYNETYRSRADNGGGISIKIAKSNSNGNLPGTDISQFEYTITDSNVWYDLSNIDGNPLQGIAVLLSASDSSCPTVQCASNDQVCKSAYNHPDDNASTHACAPNADLMLTLCSDKAATTSTATKAVSDATKQVGSSIEKLNAIQVGSSGIVTEGEVDPTTTSETASTPATDSSGASSSDMGSITQDLEEATKFVTFHNPSKRDVPHHAHEHIHNRIRRSRVFRHSDF